MLNYWIGTAVAQFTVKLPFSEQTTFNNFNDYFTALVNFAVIVAGLVAVLVIIYAGFMYAQSQGEAAKVSHAKELIAGALTGLILLFLTRLILPTLNIGRPSSLIAPAALAQTPVNQLDLKNTVLPGWDWDTLFNKVIGLLVGLVAVAAFAGILYSGFMMITAGGDPAKASKARSNLLWSILGLVVSLTAYTIVVFAFKLGGSL
jgi:hypothetical protein